MKTVSGKIKAFTLSELLIVLLITVIVVGLAFSILNLVQKQMQGIEGNYEGNTEVNLLKQALWIDFNRYSHLYYDDTKGILHCENEMGAVDYLIQNDRIVRQKDTFAVSIKTKAFYFDGIPEPSAGIIDALKLETIDAEGAKSIFVHKSNDATVYMN